MERERKKFLIPPDLQKKLLIFGMTIPEFGIVVGLFFFATKQLTIGRPMFFILPCIAIVLFVRALDSGNNALYVLTKRFRYYLAPQSYSIRSDVSDF